MRRILPTLALVLLATTTANAANWYVSMTGTNTSAGTLADPISMHKAFGDRTETSPALPGDTIWIRGGTYRPGSHAEGYKFFETAMAGVLGNPIKVKPYYGEHVIIEVASLLDLPIIVNAGYVWFYDLEIRNIDTTRKNAAARKAGVQIQAPGVKFINCVLHDTGNCFFVTTAATPAEIYGCILYNWGYDQTDNVRGHGHAIYSHSSSGGHVFRDNIALYGYSNGIHPYAESPDTTYDDVVEGNVCAMTGMFTDTGVTATEFLLGGPTGEKNSFTCRWNYGYRADGSNDVFRLGFQGSANENGLCQSNYMAGKFTVNPWANLTNRNNTFVNAYTNFYVPAGSPGTVSWNLNTYFLSAASTPFNYNGSLKSWANWKADTGFDAGSSLTAANPAANQVFIRTNLYTSGRSHVIVYNWTGANNVDVDLSTALPAGYNYTIVNAADYYGTVVKRGRYAGGTVSLPMTNLTVATPYGLTAAAATGPTFNTFVVQGTPANSIHVNTLKVLQ